MPRKKRKNNQKKSILDLFKKKRRRKKTSPTKWLLKWFSVGFIWGFAILVFTLFYFTYDLPSIKKLEEAVRTPNVRVLASNGELIANFGNLYGENIEYEDLPQHLIDAALATEDRRFFSHFGIDLIGLGRAAITNWRAGYVVQGGSTISQQLAKVIFLNPKRTMRRKIQEMILAFYLEKKFTKEEILTMYLNRIYFGSGNYGVDAAARSYFGKEVREINLYEAAMLAGLIKAPSRYSPFNNRKLAEERANIVLKSMVDNENISTYKLLSDGYNFLYSTNRSKEKYRTPYFAFWIKEHIPEYTGGIDDNVEVTTTLDIKLQKIAEDVLSDTMAWAGEKYNAEQASMVVMSPKGDVLAMVGGVDYQKSQFNRVTQAFRQPGSSFKLFVYLAALRDGRTPDDIYADDRITVDDWSPKNWNNKYIGQMPLRDAFANSVNTIAVRLAHEVGIKNVIKAAYDLGITSEIQNDLTTALGTSEVSLIELTTAYAHLANFGNSVWAHGITKITDMSDSILYNRNYSGGYQVIAPEHTAMLNDMLTEVITSGTGKNANFGRPAAGKTGTSQDYRDAWFIGFTPDYIVGVWVGNDDNTPMKKVGGGGLPTLIWKKFMSSAHRGAPIKEIPVTGHGIANKKVKEYNSIWRSIVEEFSNEPSVEYEYPNKR